MHIPAVNKQQNIAKTTLNIKARFPAISFGQNYERKNVCVFPHNPGTDSFGNVEIFRWMASDNVAHLRDHTTINANLDYICFANKVRESGYVCH
ncbi:hypothetical protein Zmor_010243 [Zophobas morio]|uniref:Uncharacterized protein n=1 Tax=Zophobas morio TaxID=2755281 RepID=A0AA38MJM0_9CUCU|nr:hypothetical protein Zmor_010243 [Zophobas morio]